MLLYNEYNYLNAASSKKKAQLHRGRQLNTQIIGGWRW